MIADSLKALSKRVHSQIAPALRLGLLICAGPVFVFNGAANADNDKEPQFRLVPTQYIAVLGDPNASSGGGAQTWGLWETDPGPRGVWLKDYGELQQADGLAPAKWQHDDADWWLDENGLIMEQPVFPIAPGKYVVTGDREMMAILTIHPEDETGDRRWELDRGATLYDVTHLPCRSARYTPDGSTQSCSPANVNTGIFPLDPGLKLPDVAACRKQDYAVLFIIGVEVTDSELQQAMRN